MNTPAPRRIALVGCGKEKLPRAAPARELYTGPLFRAALAVAQAEFGADVWILSALHGLVDLDEDVAPYDVALGELSPTERAAWARDVLGNLTDDDHGTPAHLTVYAGAPYVDALRVHLPQGWTLADPLAGLGQGQRLAWLKGRLAQLSSTSTSPLSTAAPSGPAPSERSVSTTARLTDEQREQHFHRGLTLERALAELPAMRERFLEALARAEEALRAQHTRHMAAATTGEDPDVQARQEELPLDAPPTDTKRSKPAPRKDEQPDPEPPKGAGRPRRSPATEAKGEKRAGKAASARTATVAEASPVEDDAVPAPAVPCCTCGDSLADHTNPRGAIGACHAKKCPAKPRCKAFQLGRVLGWTLTWQGGWKETNDEPVFFLSRSETDVAKHGPLLPREGGLVCADPFRPGRQVDVLEAARAKGEWSCEEGLRGVPLRVLEVVARVLAESSPAAPAAPVSAREKYLAETREGFPHFTEDEVLRRVENHLKNDGHPLPAPPEFSGLDATALLDAHLGAREEGMEYKDELEVTGTESACGSCGARRGPRARLSFSRHSRPRGVKTWRADKDSRCGGRLFSLWLCARCCTPEALAEKGRTRLASADGVEAAPAASSQVGPPEPLVSLDSVNLEEVSDLRDVLRLLKGAQGSGPRATRLRQIVSVLALSAREESWSHLTGHEPWVVVLHPTSTRGEVWLSYDRRALGTAGPWLWDGEELTRAEDWEAPRKGHVKGESAEEALRALEPALRAVLTASGPGGEA